MRQRMRHQALAHLSWRSPRRHLRERGPEGNTYCAASVEAAVRRRGAPCLIAARAKGFAWGVAFAWPRALPRVPVVAPTQFSIRASLERTPGGASFYPRCRATDALCSD